MVGGPELATVICIVSLTFAVIENVPLLATLFVSPEYTAVIVADCVGVYVIPHEADERVHGFAEKMPPLSVDCQVMIPVGEYPTTVALQVLGLPTRRVAGEQITLVVLVAGETVRVVEPELPMLLESPEYVANIVAPPAPVVETDTKHVPDARVQNVGEEARDVVAVPEN